ncbi:MAG: cyclic electron transport protein PGR5 [Prochlorotrichaceae cyanobacterium]
MFAPIVILTRNVMGKSKFTQLRGKAIAAHCKVITQVCNNFGIESATRQSMIRLAKDNGKMLGLLV